MNTFRLWVAPAVATLLWIVLTAFTLTELATVGPSLRGNAPQQASSRGVGYDGSVGPTVLVRRARGAGP